MLAPTRLGHAHGPAAHDGTITTEAPDQMWGMDATSCLTRQEGTATVFVVVDHCASECIGVHAAKPGTRFEAVEPLRQGVRALFGGYEKGSAAGLQARHDHGSQYVSDYFQDELRFLGITSSPAFVREPEGNGVAERFIRTLKEQLLWVRPFATVEELRRGAARLQGPLQPRVALRAPRASDAGGRPGAEKPTEGGMSEPRLESEPHNGPRIGDLGGGRYLTIPHGGRSDAVTINSVSRKSGAVHRGRTWNGLQRLDRRRLGERLRCKQRPGDGDSNKNEHFLLHRVLRLSDRLSIRGVATLSRARRGYLLPPRQAAPEYRRANAETAARSSP